MAGHTHISARRVSVISVVVPLLAFLLYCLKEPNWYAKPFISLCLNAWVLLCSDVHHVIADILHSSLFAAGQQDLECRALITSANAVNAPVTHLYSQAGLRSLCLLCARESSSQFLPTIYTPPSVVLFLTATLQTRTSNSSATDCIHAGHRLFLTQSITFAGLYHSHHSSCRAKRRNPVSVLFNNSTQTIRLCQSHNMYQSKLVCML